MVDLANLGQINLLLGEKQSIIAALALFARGGRIVAFGVNPPEENYDGPFPAVSVLSRYMTYPPQMVTSISSLMQSRLAEIQNTLMQLGLTGVDQATPRTAALPAQPFGAGSPPPGAQTPQFVGPKK